MRAQRRDRFRESLEHDPQICHSLWRNRRPTSSRAAVCCPLPPDRALCFSREPLSVLSAGKWPVLNLRGRGECRNRARGRESLCSRFYSMSSSSLVVLLTPFLLVELFLIAFLRFGSSLEASNLTQSGRLSGPRAPRDEGHPALGPPRPAPRPPWTLE